MNVNSYIITDETDEGQFLSFILYVPLVTLTWQFFEWLTKLFWFLFSLSPQPVWQRWGIDQYLFFAHERETFAIRYAYRNQCNSFLSLTHTVSGSLSAPSTPLPCLPPTCPYPLSPPLSPHSHQPWSKDSGRFTHTQLHSLMAFLRSGAMIWKCMCVCAVSLRIKRRSNYQAEFMSLSLMTNVLIFFFNSSSIRLNKLGISLEEITSLLYLENIQYNRPGFGEVQQDLGTIWIKTWTQR